MHCERESECASDWSGNENQNRAGPGYIDERLPVAGKEMIYRQVETALPSRTRR